MILEALVVGAAIVLAAFVYTKGQERWHVKPRLSKYSINIMGRTEESENMSITLPVFVDETDEEVSKRLESAFLIREKRLEFQNNRLLEAQKAHQAGLEKVRDERLKAAQESTAKLELVQDVKAKN
jgi:hypothetical protein